MRPNGFRSLIAMLLFAQACNSAIAQSWPVRPVKFVVPFASGVSPDVSARIVAEFLPRALGQAVVVENMPGANGFVAAQAVARAPADGYTALVAPTPKFALPLGTVRWAPFWWRKASVASAPS